jgi:hypothetical protein
MRSRGWIRLLVTLCAVAVTLSASRRAEAFAWMIRHDYSGCVQCHLDPSGAGILTAYGRAQSEIVLSTRWGNHKEDEEPGRFKDFLFGAFEMPDWLLAQVWSRNAILWTTTDGHLVDRRYLQMRADAEVAVKKDMLRAAVQLGYNDIPSAPFSELAWVTSASSFGNLVAREFWAGLTFADDKVLVRAGRLALPFGVRNIEHISFVRTATRTDINQDQQYGIAASYEDEHIRAEAMGVLGNYQVRPDDFRDRGYAAYGEYYFAPHYAAGISSEILHAQRDLLANVPLLRQAHGVFARAAPVEPVVVFAEFDALIASPQGQSTQAGWTGFLQVDFEPIQGLHFMATGESLYHGAPGENTTFGVWGSTMWFPLSHFELRGDVIIYMTSGAPTNVAYLLQGQVYL